jgi:hypothetical protein
VSTRHSSVSAQEHPPATPALATAAEILIPAWRPCGHRDRAWLPWPESCTARTCGSRAAGSSPVIGVRTGGWDIRGRWFGVLAGATPQLGELRRGQTIPWRVIAAQIAPRDRRDSH